MRSSLVTATADASAQDLLNLVKAHSVTYRTTDPLMAWTHVAGAGPCDDRSDAVPGPGGGEAYPLLGWASGPQVLAHVDSALTDPGPHRFYDVPTLAGRRIVDPFLAREVDRLEHALAIDLATMLQRDHLVLGHPARCHAATRGRLDRTIPLRLAGPWWSADRDAVAGLFAIDAVAFKEHFAGIGVAA